MNDGEFQKKCTTVRIKTILCSEFDQLLPCNPVIQDLMVEQVEWFSNRSGNLLGTIAKGKGVAGWNYAILKRDKQGDFRIRNVTCNFFNLEAARVDLLLSMTGIEKIGSGEPTANFWFPPMPARLLALNPGL